MSLNEGKEKKPLYRVNDGNQIEQRDKDGDYKAECGAPPTEFELNLLQRMLSK